MQFIEDMQSYNLNIVVILKDNSLAMTDYYISLYVKNIKNKLTLLENKKRLYKGGFGEGNKTVYIIQNNKIASKFKYVYEPQI